MQDCLEVIVKHTGANNCLFSFGNAIKQAACGIVVLEPGVYKLIAYTTDKTELTVNVSKGSFIPCGNRSVFYHNALF